MRYKTKQIAGNKCRTKLLRGLERFGRDGTCGDVCQSTRPNGLFLFDAAQKSTKGLIQWGLNPNKHTIKLHTFLPELEFLFQSHRLLAS